MGSIPTTDFVTKHDIRRDEDRKKELQMATYKKFQAWFIPNNPEIKPFTHIVEGFDLDDAKFTLNMLASMWKGHFQDILELSEAITKHNSFTKGNV